MTQQQRQHITITITTTTTPSLCLNSNLNGVVTKLKARADVLRKNILTSTTAMALSAKEVDKAGLAEILSCAGDNISPLLQYPLSDPPSPTIYPLSYNISPQSSNNPKITNYSPPIKNT